jgi:lipid-A-disaccharide synthase
MPISGIGGGRMRAAGAELFADLTPYAVIGFVEVIKHLSVFQKAFRLVLEEIRRQKPSAIVLIDYPGFNLRLARRIKKDFPEVKIIYYISPQIWAWGKKRMALIKQVVDKMLVVFDFEEKLYRDNNVDVEFVGHPLTESVQARVDSRILGQAGFSPQDKIIALLPGSREGEVQRLLPAMLKSAQLLNRSMPEIRFALLKSPNISGGQITKIISACQNPPVRIIDPDMHDILSACSFAWVCSGTATLETAIRQVPMLIVYKTSFPTWFISRMLIKLPYIGLVNVVAGKQIVPELIQYKVRADNIVAITLEFFSSGKIEQTKKELASLRRKLGTWEASKKAADSILRVITTE